MLPLPNNLAFIHNLWRFRRSKEGASADLQAAAYRRNVARSDRTEINVAVTKMNELTTAAKREEKEPNESPRRARGLSAS